MSPRPSTSRTRTCRDAVPAAVGGDAVRRPERQPERQRKVDDEEASAGAQAAKTLRVDGRRSEMVDAAHQHHASQQPVADFVGVDAVPQPVTLLAYCVRGVLADLRDRIVVLVAMTRPPRR